MNSRQAKSQTGELAGMGKARMHLLLRRAAEFGQPAIWCWLITDIVDGSILAENRGEGAIRLFPPASRVTPGRIRISFFLRHLPDDAVYDRGISLRAVLIARG